jgi:hypothetical protein
MSQARCETCPFRAKYDNNPRSILGRLWRFHINFCPGWKSYMRSLPDDKKNGIRQQYGIR